jgi:uncharacterized protein (DUF1501 family)
MTKLNASRREFLKVSSLMSVAGAAGAPFALNLATMAAASAQTAAGDFKALICLFMYGGNDSANMVLPTDTDSWTTYTTVRNQQPDPISLPPVGATGGVIEIVPNTAQTVPGGSATRTFALHPALTNVRDLFNAGRLGIVANVGPLIAPTTLTQYNNRSVPLPAKLFSHNDQQSTWQAFAPEGAKVGWGGRMGDLLAAQNTNALFTCISTSGNAVFLSGQSVLQYQVGGNGAIRVNAVNGTSLFGSSTAPGVLRSLISGDRAHLLEKEYSATVKRSIDAESLLRSSLLPAGAGGIANPPAFVTPQGNSVTNGLATQLQTVLRTIGAYAALGIRRQVFLVSIGGFDTHDGQNNAHRDLYGRIGHALKYLDDTLAAMPNGLGDMRSQVTLFTASDFGRTFTSNGDGTDHGWGAHHLVWGGAVKGKDIYGRFPQLGLQNNPDAVGSGSFLPNISVDQYGATLARWFGIGDGQLNDIFPNLRNFATRDLGFMS